MEGILYILLGIAMLFGGGFISVIGIVVIGLGVYCIKAADSGMEF